MRNHIRIRVKRKETMTAEEVKRYYNDNINAQDKVANVYIWPDGKRAEIISISPNRVVWASVYEIIGNRLKYVTTQLMTIDQRA